MTTRLHASDPANALFAGYSEFVSDKFAPGEALTPEQAAILHAALGVAGEAGELVDAIKKHVFYKRPLDVNNVIEECGDILFYIQALLSLVDTNVYPHANLPDVIVGNIDKLDKRYASGKFSTEQAIARADKA